MSDWRQLARTWNGNEPGLLWEKLWGVDDAGYSAKLICSGVFSPPKRFESEDAFWTAYHAEAEQFRGRIIAPSASSEEA